MTRDDGSAREVETEKLIIGSCLAAGITMRDHHVTGGARLATVVDAIEAPELDARSRSFMATLLISGERGRRQ